MRQAAADWWMSTKSPRNIFKKAFQTSAADAFLREHPSVDAQLLANDLHMTIDNVYAYQRHLGLRKCKANR